MGHPRPLFRFISDLFKQTSTQFKNKLMRKNVHPVYGAGKYEIGWPLKIKKGLNNALEPKALIKLAQNCGMSKQRKKSL